jgi:hypothetical protein
VNCTLELGPMNSKSGLPEKEEKTMFKDNCGTTFSTFHGQPPVGPQQVTTNNNGVLGTGFWNGSQVVKH